MNPLNVEQLNLLLYSLRLRQGQLVVFKSMDGDVESTSKRKAAMNDASDNQQVPLLPAAPLVSIRWLIIGVGVPLHVLVASVILRTRQLHNPRNAFWLGNIACHLSTLLMGAFEMMVLTQKQVFFCRIYTLLVGSPYTNLLVSLLLATADRWVAISHPLYHRKRITVKFVAACLVGSWLLVLLALTSPYWSGRVQLPSCFVQPDVMMAVTVCHSVLVILIILAQVAVCVRARSYFRLHQPCNRQPTSSSSNNILKPEEYFVHLPDKTISRLELEASVTLWCGVASLCLFTLPLACIFLVIYGCRVKGLPWCGKVADLIPYARELLLLHAVVSPLLYVFRSREFVGAFRRMLPSYFQAQRRQNQDIPLRHI